MLSVSLAKIDSSRRDLGQPRDFKITRELTLRDILPT